MHRLRFAPARVRRSFDFRCLLLPHTCRLVRALVALTAAAPASAAPAAFAFFARAVVLIRVLHTLRAICICAMASAFRIRTLRRRGLRLRARMFFTPWRARFRGGGGSAAVLFTIIRMPLPLTAASTVLTLSAAFPRFRTLVPPFGMLAA